MENFRSHISVAKRSGITKKLSEQILQMRSQVYLQEVKAKVLTDTISSISLSKKELQKYTRSLDKRSKELETQKQIIEIQGKALSKRNLQLEKIRSSLEEKVQDRTQALQTSHDELQLYGKIFENTNEGIMVVDENIQIIAVNKAFTRIMGYEEEEVLGKGPNVISSGRHDGSFYKKMWDSLKKKGHWEGEIWNRRKDGTVFPERLSISKVENEQGDVSNYVGVFIDITQQKLTEEKLVFQAQHDPLTELPNRLFFNARLHHALTRAHRIKSHLAVLFIDLDNFKTLNDSLGHPAGDQALIEAAKRLKEILREEDTVARLGGDEFIILLEDIEHSDQPANVARKIMKEFSKPFKIEHHTARLSASIGISLFPQDGDTVTTLMKNADMAMFKAKDRGRNAYHYYTESLTTSALDRFHMDSLLHHAIEKQEFFLSYQPQYSLLDNQIVGMEALIRWNPQGGQKIIPPQQFIPLAEENGMIIEIGKWVISETCHQIKSWQETGLPVCPIAINISARQIMKSEEIIDHLRACISETNIDPKNIVLELTESTLMGKEKEILKTLHALKSLGTSLAIDDFGTGYSSLSYLKRFPIDKLKIDQSFIKDLVKNEDDRAITIAIIALGKALRLQVLAEGVETKEQLNMLRKLGCDEVQGFYCGRPVAAKKDPFNSDQLLAEGSTK